MYFFGIEAEYASNTEGIIHQLTENGWARQHELHHYHCDCDNCDFGSGVVWRGQNDSTVNGEIISHVFNSNDWGSANDAILELCTSARDVGATTSSATGMHVHVSSSDGDAWMALPAAYFLTERFIMELVAPGALAQKRQMNRTMLTAMRDMSGDWDTSESFIRRYQTPALAWPIDAGAWFHQMFRDVCYRDRHMDLNYSRTHDTYEFRVYNATLAEWRMELAARLSVAMMACANQIFAESLAKTDYKFEELVAIGLRSGYSTKRPLIPVSRFMAILGRFDPVLLGLLRRQAQYMRRQFAKAVIAPGEGEGP